MRIHGSYIHISPHHACKVLYCDPMQPRCGRLREKRKPHLQMGGVLGNGSKPTPDSSPDGFVSSVRSGKISKLHVGLQRGTHARANYLSTYVDRYSFTGNPRCRDKIKRTAKEEENQGLVSEATHTHVRVRSLRLSTQPVYVHTTAPRGPAVVGFMPEEPYLASCLNVGGGEGVTGVSQAGLVS